MKNWLKQLPLISPVLQKIRRGHPPRQGRDRLKQAIATGQPLNLVLGSGEIHDPGWIPTDLDFLDLLQEEHWASFFQEGAIAALLAEHVWEHLTLEEGIHAAQRCYRYLQPGGYLRIAVPDGYHPDPTYIDYVKVGGTGAGAEDHKVLYTYETFQQVFEAAGFQVTLLEYFDAQGNFHFEPWDPAGGKIRRSKRFDPRNQAGELNYTSIILDAHR